MSTSGELGTGDMRVAAGALDRRAAEDGVLALFRVLVALAALLFAAVALAQSLRSELSWRAPAAMGVVASATLLAYLFWKRGRHRLGASYLPIALAFASIVPIVGFAIVVQTRLAIEDDPRTAMSQSWVLIILLMAPVMVVAWQYGLRRVLWFCVATSALDLVLNLPLAFAGRVPGATVTGVVLVRCLFLLPVGYAITMLASAQRTRHEQLARENDRLLRHAAVLEELATTRERNRLARELHDTLAHALGGLAVQLEAVNAVWKSDPDAAHALLAEALATARSGLTEARRAVVALRATPLEELGLPIAIDELAKSAAARAGVALHVQLPDRIDASFQPTAQTIYRVAEEALTNVVRHAGARRLTVTLEQTGGRLALTVADDGCGFDASICAAPGHFGILGMHERARLVGASIAIETAPGKGTTIRVTVEN